MKQSYSVSTILADCTHVYTYVQIVNTHIKCYIYAASFILTIVQNVIAYTEQLQLTWSQLHSIAMCLDTEVHTCIGYLFIIESKCVNAGYNFSV